MVRKFILIQFFSVFLLLLLSPINVFAADSSVCIFKDGPPSSYKYTTLRALKVGKGSYGSINDIKPRFAALAKKAEADAVIYYYPRQRFGFWPWRIVRPVITGTAIKWVGEDKESYLCTEVNGFFL